MNYKTGISELYFSSSKVLSFTHAIAILIISPLDRGLVALRHWLSGFLATLSHKLKTYQQKALRGIY